MKKIQIVFVFAFALAVLTLPRELPAQDTQPSGDSGAKSGVQTPAPPASNKSAESCSGMYSFLKEGEFIQVTVEDGGSVTGFISRFGEGESDKGAFLDQFFKTAKLDGNKLSFTTEVVHGVAFDFRGTVERGDGKKSGEEGYFLIKGTLTENISDENKKVTSHSRDVLFKLFPQEAAPTTVRRQ